MTELTAAHRTLPFNTWLIVENLNNRRAVEVLSDLGPTTTSFRGDLVELDIELPKHGIGAPLATALRAAAGALLDVQPLADRIWQRAREMPGAARLPRGRQGRR